jgi:UDP-N-acetyl-D-glucosamine/UDP-N-acetyl-D-galactosamine dehydrogenase
MTLNRKIAVIGLGYVGLPVAAAFTRLGDRVVAFDISSSRVQQLRAGYDRTHELSSADLAREELYLTDDPDDLRAADFFIVTVPTPIDDAHRPDLRALLSASRIIGNRLKRGDIIVYESTVYPGATEEECVPVLEESSGLKCGSDFNVAYSPERINPGDKQHRFETIQKVIAAQDERTLNVVAEVYSSVVTAGVYRTTNIKTAEAAKIIENTQRDLNIALMNELSTIFHQLDIDTSEVLAAAGTKWNFLNFTPGLVGGHCIGVDPYYLTHRAERSGYHPEVILAGRRVNDSMGARIARQCVRMIMNGNGRSSGEDGGVTILGLTFKENIPDIRNSKVMDIIRELQGFGIPIQVHDPIADPGAAQSEYGIKLLPRHALQPAQAIILAVPHHCFVDEGWSLVTSLLKNAKGAVLDVKAKLPTESRPAGIDLWRL